MSLGVSLLCVNKAGKLQIRKNKWWIKRHGTGTMYNNIRFQINDFFYQCWAVKTPWNHPLSYQHGVSDKKDGSVVAHYVPVSFFCIHFYSETPGVTSCVSRSALSTLSSKSEKYLIIKICSYLTEKSPSKLVSKT